MFKVFMVIPAYVPLVCHNIWTLCDLISLHGSVRDLSSLSNDNENSNANLSKFEQEAMKAAIQEAEFIKNR